MGALGVNQSSSVVRDLYGGASARAAGRYGREFARPSSFAFGWDAPEGWEDKLSSKAAAGNPFASYLQTTRGLLPQVQSDASRAGQEIASRAPGLFQGYMDQAQGFLNQLPGLQAQLSGYQGQLGQASNTLGRAEANVNTAGAQYGVDQARQMLEQARSPIQAQALYQNALRQSLASARAGAGGRGLLDAGVAQAQEEGLARDLAAQSAQSQFANQQAALGGYGGALGVQQQGAGLLGQLAGQRGQLAGLGGQLTGLATELAQAGIPVSEGMLAALPGYAQLLMSGSQLPFNAAQQLQGFFAASQNPTLALLQATAPQLGQESKGWHA